MVRQWIANPRSPVQIWVPPNKLWGRGEMVDTTDLNPLTIAVVGVQVPPPPNFDKINYNIIKNIVLCVFVLIVFFIQIVI